MDGETHLFIVKQSISLKRFPTLKSRLVSIHQRQSEGLPSGFPAFDTLTGVNGYPVGGVIEIYGRAGYGKSTVGLMALGSAQRIGLPCVMIDVDRSFRLQRAAAFGVHDDLLWCQPKTPMELFRSLLDASRCIEQGLIVVDSLGVGGSKVVEEGSLFGVQSPSFDLLCRDYLPYVLREADERRNVVLLLSPVRTVIDMLGYEKHVSTGGEELKGNVSMQVHVHRRKLRPDELRTAGVAEVLRMTIEKNRIGACGEVEVEIPSADGKKRVSQSNSDGDVKAWISPSTVQWT